MKFNILYTMRGSEECAANSLIRGNICIYEVYKGHMGQTILSLRRNFSVTTDRYAALI